MIHSAKPIGLFDSATGLQAFVTDAGDVCYVHRAEPRPIATPASLHCIVYFGTYFEVSHWKEAGKYAPRRVNPPRGKAILRGKYLRRKCTETDSGPL